MILKRKPKFVLELSSSAVKLISKDEKIIKRTNTKQYLNSSNTLDPIKYRLNVLPEIVKLLQQADNKALIIATALYRSITNKEEIVKMIENETGSKVNILSGKEEALAIRDAVKYELPDTKHILIIDSGSMSVELSTTHLNYYQSFAKNQSVTIKPDIKKLLQDDAELLIVVTGEKMAGLTEKQPIYDPIKQLGWHKVLQNIIKQIGSHPVLGTRATPGLGILLRKT